MRYCIYCGMPMEDDDKYCTRCGREAEEDQASADAGGHSNAAMTPPPRQMSEQTHTSPQKPQNTQKRGRSGMNYDSGIDIGRLIIYATAGVLVAVVGFALFVKLKPVSKDPADSGNNTYAYYDQQTDVGESYDQGQQTPSSGQVDNNTPAATGAGGSAEVSVQGGQDQEVQVTSEDDDAETGWVIDEDGNVVYYAAEGEEFEGNDQTGEEVEEEEVAVATQSDSESTELFGSTQAGDDSYILSDSSSRYYSKEELSELSDYDLQMAINEIYARHGRKFDTKSIRDYFEEKSWYNGTISPADFDKNEASYFNKYEKANKDLMAKIRAEREKASGKTINWE